MTLWLPKLVAISILSSATAIATTTIEELTEFHRVKDEAKLQEWRPKLEAMGAANEENLPELGRLLVRLRMKNSFMSHRVEADQLSKDIQTRMLNFPGHATYFEKPLAEERKRVLEGQAQWGLYHLHATQAFAIFAHLPSDDTMRVLGRMLDDTKGMAPEDAYPRQARETFQQNGSNAERAASALRHIGIANPSDFGPWREDWDRIRFWREWWQEVKDGKRTYRFVGSNVEYGYDGPVVKEPPRRPRPSKPDPGSLPPSAKTQPSPGESKGSLHIGMIVSVILVAVVSGLLIFKKLRRRR